MILPQTPSFRLEGKRALVTGGSSGIGLGCAVGLSAAGASVVAAARSKHKLDALSAAAREKGLDLSGAVMDVTDLEATRDVIAGLGDFDILVHAAGIARHGPAIEAEQDDFDAVMAVNLRAAYFLSQQIAARLIKAKKGGSIIHITSQMAHVGGIERSVYCASKFGVEGFVKAMAIEWGNIISASIRSARPLYAPL